MRILMCLLQACRLLIQDTARARQWFHRQLEPQALLLISEFTFIRTTDT